MGRLGGSWVKCPTLGFGSIHDLRIVKLSPILGSMIRGESVWDSVSPFPSPTPSAFPSLKRESTLSLTKINNFFKKMQKEEKYTSIHRQIIDFILPDRSWSFVLRNYIFIRVSGWQRQLNIQHLTWAQVMISVTVMRSTPQVGLCAEWGACFRSSLCLPLSLPPHSLSP